MFDLNLETAIKINQNLIRDESKIKLEYNEESGVTNFIGFAYYVESDQEKQFKDAMSGYVKLRIKLNKRLNRK